ncbi:MAG: hypothetical protein ACI4LL_05560 [Anaerovoracaceae bacterium]
MKKIIQHSNNFGCVIDSSYRKNTTFPFGEDLRKALIGGNVV